MQPGLARVSLLNAFCVALACSSTSRNRVQPPADSGTAGTGMGGAGNAGQGGSGRATGGAAGSSGGVGATGGSAGEDSGSSGVGGASGSGGSGGTAGTTATGGAGGTGGGGSGGSAGIDAGPPPPACRSVPSLASTLFCDSFDTSDLRQWTHFASGTDGRTVWTPTPRHSPTGGALHSVKSAQGPADPLYANFIGNLTSGRVYLRVWLYVPNTTVINEATGNASLLVLGETAPGNFRGVSLVLWQTGFSLQINPVGAQPAKFNVMVPRNQWFCVQIDFPIVSPAMKSQFHLRFNESPIMNIEPDAAVSTALPFSRVMAGVNYIAPNQVDPVTVYYDDLVVDTRDIACSP